jgi:hypothetical protein
MREKRSLTLAFSTLGRDAASFEDTGPGDFLASSWELIDDGLELAAEAGTLLAVAAVMTENEQRKSGLALVLKELRHEGNVQCCSGQVCGGAAAKATGAGDVDLEPP